jgi:hypothetical protein
MNIPWQIRSLLVSALLAGRFFISGNALADGSNPDLSTAASSPPPINFQVLQTTKINLGNRSAIFNLVAPPALPPAPPPDPTPTPLTPEQIMALEQQQPPPKKNVAIFCSATVYDRQVSQLCWSDESGSHCAFSNVDLNYFCNGSGGFETADTTYFLIMGLGNDTRQGAMANNIQVPTLSQFSATRSQYVIVQDGSNAPTADSLKWLDDMHAYFDGNKEQLIDLYNKQTADRIAREQWLKDHPPVPVDTVINFWPVNSTNYQTSPQGGQP